MQITKAVVPAGGRGTRLYPVTQAQPKEMLPLGTRPTIQGVVEEIAGAGITDILIVTSQGKSSIEDHFEALSCADLDDATAAFPLFDRSRTRFYYTRQGAPRGLGDAIACGEHFAGMDHFVVALGDCLITGPEACGPVRRLIDAHIATRADASILVQQVSLAATKRYGIIKPGPSLDGGVMQLADIVEKPGPQVAPSRYAVCARYVFSPMLFSYLRGLKPGYGAEIQLTDAIRAMIRDGKKVIAVPLQDGELRLDVGNFVSYSRAFIRTMLTHPEHGEGLRRYVANLLAYLDDPVRRDPDLPDDES